MHTQLRGAFEPALGWIVLKRVDDLMCSTFRAAAALQAITCGNPLHCRGLWLAVVATHAWVPAYAGGYDSHALLDAVRWQTLVSALADSGHSSGYCLMTTLQGLNACPSAFCNAKIYSQASGGDGIIWSNPTESLMGCCCSLT